MKIILFIAVFLLLNASCSADSFEENLHFPAEETMEESFSRFYTPVEFNSNPRMEQINLPIATDDIFNLNSVLQLGGLYHVPEQINENGFVVVPISNPTDNPVRAFERLEDRDQPIYVSSGIPLHLLHIFFDQILQQVETEDLYPDLLIICEELYQSNLSRGNLMNASFFAVSLVFLDEDFIPHGSIEEIVNSEVSLMREHAGFSFSPIFGYKEDYSQYVPRGHYTASEELENYFMVMMYLGRITFILHGGEPFGPDEEFLVSEGVAEEMTQAALLLVSDLNTIVIDEVPLKYKWQRIYEITAFFAGFADDLSVPQYQTAAEEVSGELIESTNLFEQSFYEDFTDFIAENLEGPAIYSGTGASVVNPEVSGEFDPAELQTLLSKTTGFRFFGQRYTPDSEMLGKFVFPNISVNPSGEQRFMPSGLDVAASFRCAAALEIIEEDGTVLFGNYCATLDSMQTMVDNYTLEEWHSTLYMCWLHSLELLSAPRTEGYPNFMQTPAWDRCTLSTFLASWAMLRHDTILYAKQSYTAMSGCAPNRNEPVPSAGFVEPVPEVYAELRATLQMAQRALEHYNLSDSDITNRFKNAESLLETLQLIAEKQLAGEMLTTTDADFLKGFAGYLENAISWGATTTEGLETSLIADVHTDQNSSSVLEVASGNLDYCIVVYKRADGVIEAAIGPVLSYYQFNQPMSNRLTDETWRDMLSEGETERPEWTKTYILE